MANRSRLLFTVFALMGLGWATDIKEEESVLVLKKSNFDSALKSYSFILVEFYAPWCGHCKALAPEYAKAATKLNEMKSDIKLGKVDATEESELAEQFGVRGYPTLKFFKDGQPLDYSGGRQADEIVNWLLKKTGPPAKKVGSLTDLQSFISGNRVAVVGYFTDEESPAAKNFLSVAAAVDDHPFAIVSDPSVLTENKAEDGKVVLYKQFDDPEVTYSGSEDPNELRKFITTESIPLVTEFNHETAQMIFGGDFKNHLLLFLSKQGGDFEKYLEPIKPAAKDYKDKLLFVVINIDEPDHQRILEFFGIPDGDVPTMRIIKLDDEMIKYRPESKDLDITAVRAFIDSFLDGTLKEHLLSQTLPDDWDKLPVKVLVASNFDEVVFDKTKDVLVEFYAPWCGHCKQLAPIYEKLAENLKDKSDLLIAKMDATVNELEHTKIKSYPVIKLYKKGTNEAVQYEGERTLEGLTKFLESGGDYGRSESSDESEEEEDDVQPKDEL